MDQVSFGQTLRKGVSKLEDVIDWLNNFSSHVQTASARNLIQDVGGSGAKLSTLTNAAANQLPYFTGPAAVTLLTFNPAAVGAYGGFANPTASVGATPVNGVATTAMRSDAAPPLANAANNTVLGNVSGGSAAPIPLTQAQLTALVNTFTSSLSGAAPASGGGTTNFLRADGSWQPTLASGSFANPTASVGLTAVNGSAVTAMRSDAAPALSQAIAPTWTQPHTFSGNPCFYLKGTGTVNVSNLSQNTIQYQGQGNSLTTSIHANPGSGTLPTDTITEFVSERTNLQAFGGNYGRWSYSNLGSAQGNISGIIGEFGGTTPIGSYLIQIGIENPSSTFTVYEGWRFYAAAGISEDDNQGSVGFGNGATTPRNQISLNIANIGAAGTRDSHALLWEGKANNGTERATWWRQKVNVTAQAGTSQFLWQSNLNGAGWSTRMTLTDAGGLLLGLASAVAQGAGVTPSYQFAATGTAAALGVVRQTTPGAGGALAVLGSSRGTVTTPGAVQSGDGLGSVLFAGDNGTNLGTTSAAVLAQVDAALSGTSIPGRLVFGTTTSGNTNYTEAARIDSKQNVIQGTAAVATNATDGFLYVATCAGAPTGVPTSYTGRAPMVYDTTNNKLWAYSGGAWKGVALV